MNGKNSSEGRSGQAWPPGRWVLIRDALVFQGKLVVDGLRDFALLPVSLVAALLSLVRGGDRVGREFYEVVAFGKRTERWINLFGAADRKPPDDDDIERSRTVDGLVEKLERKVVEQYEKGGMTASAKRAIDRMLDSVQGSADGRSDDRYP